MCPLIANLSFLQVSASDERVNEHEADLRDRVADGGRIDVRAALPHVAAKAASRVPRFQRHLVTRF